MASLEEDFIESNIDSEEKNKNTEIIEDNSISNSDSVNYEYDKIKDMHSSYCIKLNDKVHRYFFTRRKENEIQG